MLQYQSITTVLVASSKVLRKDDHLIVSINIKQDRQKNTDKQTRSTSSEPPMAQSSPQKKERQNYSRVPRRWLLLFPSGGKLLVLFAAFIFVFGFVALLQESDV